MDSVISFVGFDTGSKFDADIEVALPEVIGEPADSYIITEAVYLPGIDPPYA